MFRLLQIEFIKLKNSKGSKLLIIIYFLLLTSISLIAAIKFDIGQIKFYLAEQGIFNFPYIWHFNTFMAAFFKLFLVLVIVSMTANEYSNRTIKQNLIDGLSKKEFILSKFYMVFTFALISTLFIFVISLILGLMYSDFKELSIIILDLEYMVAYFVKLLGFFSFGLFLGILIKRAAFAIAAMFVWFVMESISLGLLKWKFNNDPEKAENIIQFFPLYSMSNLIEQPFGRLKAVKAAANQLKTTIEYDYAIHWHEIAIVLVWTFLFTFFSYKLLQKRDL
ncbi:MAG: ABC transporter permease [Flavobacteriaceae bacterium]|nr:ABC transporter permease [Flavobacteriaceae bacterium]